MLGTVQERRNKVGRGLRHLVVALCVMLIDMSAARAHSLPVPEGDVILTVSGDITHTNGDDVARFDRAMLRDLPQGVIETHTPWTEGVSRFEGPRLDAIADAVGAQGDSLHVVALNDFAADVPLPEARDYGVILAMRRDGEAMPIREYGPLFVVYPFDEHPELQTEAVRFRSVWQVSRIVVE